MNLFQDENWQVMLLKEIYQPFNDKNYLFEIKFDGNRALIYATSTKVKIKSRNGKDITSLYPELQNIASIVSKPTIFDGEIVAFNNNLPSFSKLQSRAHLKDKVKICYLGTVDPVAFICFDILYANKNLIDLPLIKRKKILDSYPDNEVFIKIKYIINNGKQYFQKIKKLNLEGMVAKKIDSPYLINTRSDNWLKIKNWQEEKFVIGAYIEKPNISTISLVLGEYINNKLSFVGKVTTAKNNKIYSKLKQTPKTKNPFIDFKEKAIYLKPTNTCLVMYKERTKNNHLREPIFKE